MKFCCFELRRQVQLWHVISFTHRPPHLLFFLLRSNTQILASIPPPYPFKLPLFSIRRGLLSGAILLYHQSDSHQVKTPLSFSFSFCVFSDPLNVCAPLADLEDHTGVRPPQWWSRTTTDVRGKEEKNNTKRKRLEEEQSGEEGAALGASNWKSAMRKVQFWSEHTKSRCWHRDRPNFSYCTSLNNAAHFNPLTTKQLRFYQVPDSSSDPRSCFIKSDNYSHSLHTHCQCSP